MAIYLPNRFTRYRCYGTGITELTPERGLGRGWDYLTAYFWTRAAAERYDAARERSREEFEKERRLKALEHAQKLKPRSKPKQ